MDTVRKKRPFGFYVCSLGFTFERMAFYTVKYLLVIWIATTAAAGGLGLNDTTAAAMSASFVAWSYITPIFGGYIADHWVSPRICVPIGMVLMGLGYLCTWKADSIGMVWAMIILVSIGTGLFKGNLSGISGLLFQDEEELNSAFSVQYSFVNIGSFIGTGVIAILATTGIGGIKLSFGNVFLICAILMFIDAVWFIVNSRKLGDAGKKPFKNDQRQFVEASDSKGKESSQPLTASDKKRIVAIVLVTLLSGVFWMVWYMAYMPAYNYFGYGEGADFLNHANWYIGDFLIPTSWFDSLNALTCIILGPVFAIMWNKLAQRPKGDISMFKKTALGTILVGVAYVVMVLADIVRGDGQCSIVWIMFVCLLMSVGEMVFSPLGNSFISQLAPAKVLGLLLGFWPIAVFLAQQVYPTVYAFLKTVPFVKGYGILAAIVIVIGVLLWAFSGKLDELEKED